MPSHLTVDQRALLEADLKQRHRQLELQLNEHLAGDSRVEHAQSLLEQDSDDRERHVGDREVDMARSDTELMQLVAIGAALGRVQGEGYGQCVDCDAPIPFNRLKLEPWAARCVACETAREQAPDGQPRAARHPAP